jgi:hypothetical protein
VYAPQVDLPSRRLRMPVPFIKAGSEGNVGSHLEEHTRKCPGLVQVLVELDVDTFD